MGMKKIILAGTLGIAALAGTNLPGLEATKASAASIETNMSTIEGRVVEIDNNVISVESKQYTNSVRVYLNSIPNVKIGDEVKVTGTMMRDFAEYMLANSIEKVQGTDTLHQGSYIEDGFGYEYEIGYVTKAGKFKAGKAEINYVIVQYTGINDSKRDVRVELTQGQKFNVGDKVKVHLARALRSDVLSMQDGIEKVNDSINSTSTGSLEKKGTTLKPGMYEKEDGQPNFVIGEITKIDKDYTDYVSVTYPSKNGKNDLVYVELTQGQQFNIGDMVRVEFHDGSNFHGPDKTTYDHIQKFNDKIKQNTNKEQWVWS
nr:hypothetical protein [Bacillus sp. AR2-1]